MIITPPQPPCTPSPYNTRNTNPSEHSLVDDGTELTRAFLKGLNSECLTTHRTEPSAAQHITKRLMVVADAGDAQREAEQADSLIASFLLDSDSDREFWENLDEKLATPSPESDLCHLHAGETTAREKQWEQKQEPHSAPELQPCTSTAKKRHLDLIPTVSPLYKGYKKRFKKPVEV